MDMFKGVENTPLYPRNIPDAATFQTNARGSAVNNSDHVIVYEDIFGNFMAARAWWMFKVSFREKFTKQKFKDGIKWTLKRRNSRR